MPTKKQQLNSREAQQTMPHFPSPFVFFLPLQCSHVLERVICLRKRHMVSRGHERQDGLESSQLNCPLMPAFLLPGQEPRTRRCSLSLINRAPSQAAQQPATARQVVVVYMSRFAGQTSTRPWVGMAGSGATASEPAAADVARDDATAAMRGAGAGAGTNASAISFGFAATAVLVSMFLLMAIFEHLIKPGLASSSSRGASGSHEDAADDDGEGRGHRHRMGGSPPARLRERDDAAPDKLCHLPKVLLCLLTSHYRNATVLSSCSPCIATYPRPAHLCSCGSIYPSMSHTL
jgi:hypothetical protein